jgi:hypothetical protein
LFSKALTDTDAYLTRIKQWKQTHYQEALLNSAPMREKIAKILKERTAIKS